MLEERTKEFRDALDFARDQAIEGTEMMSRATGLRTVMIHEEVVATHDDVLVTRHNTEDLKAGIETYTRTVEKYGTQLSDRFERLGGKISDRVSHLSVDMGQMNKKLDEHAAARQQEHERHGRSYQELKDLILTQFTELKTLSERENMRSTAERSRRIAKREKSIQESQQISRTLLLNLLLDRKRECGQTLTIMPKQWTLMPVFHRN
jgi:hypothetical protein